MQTTTIRTGFAALALIAGLALSPAAWAASTTFKAALHGTSQLPPLEGKGRGVVTATYNDQTKKLTYSARYTGLSGPATAAHFHGPAGPNEIAGVEVPVPGNAKSPIKGSATLDDEQASDLMAGKWYFNVHTKANPAGEIRGQLTRGR